MVQRLAWGAVGIATIAGAAIKFLVAFSYSFTDSQGNRFAKPLISMLGLFLGMLALWTVAPWWDTILARLKAMAGEQAGPAGSTAPLLDDAHPEDTGGTAVAPSLNGGKEEVTGTRQSHSCPSTWRLRFLLVCLAAMDVAASLCINASLLFVAPSIVAAVRGLTTVWTLLLQQCVVPVLPRGWVEGLREKDDRLVRADYGGAALTVIGVFVAAAVTVAPTVVGSAASSASRTGPAVSLAEAVIGVAFVVAGTAIQALQFLAEQILLDDDTEQLSPPAFVGAEGLAGSVMCVILLALAQFIHVPPVVAASLDGSGVLEMTFGAHGTLDFLRERPALIATWLGQAVGASVLCLALFALPTLGGGLQMRMFALVGGRGLVLVGLDLVVYVSTNGAAGLAPTWWALGDAIAVVAILAGGYCMGEAQRQRAAARA